MFQKSDIALRNLVYINALYSSIFVLVYLFVIGSRASVLYHLIRVVFILSAILVNRIKLNSNFYLAGIREMPEATYWSLVNLASLLITVSYSYFSLELSQLIRGIEASFMIAGILVLLMAYHAKPWITESEKNRAKKIRKLIRKAHLTREELEIIRPHLIEIAKSSQRTPFSWNIIRWGISVTIALLLSLYAGEIVDFLERFPFTIH